MKTIQITLTSALIFAISVSVASAQQVSEVTFIASANGETTSEVISTIGKDFNEVKPVEKALASISRLPKHWTITEEQLEQSNSSDKPEYIEVILKFDTGEQIGFYNRNGDMTSFKEIDNNGILPTFASQTLKSSYGDYKVLGNKEVIDSGTKSPDYYKVQIAKAGSKKNIYFDLNGNELDKHLKEINKEPFVAN